MRYLGFGTGRVALALCAVASASGCSSTPGADAYGNFEATEVVVSAQATGQLERFTVAEGSQLARGADVALVDTTQLALQRTQLVAQGAAAKARTAQASREIRVLLAQRDVSQRAYQRTKRLHAEQAATAQQLDQAERDYHVLLAQIAAAQAQRNSIAMEATAARASVAQVGERIEKSRVLNPTTGTVLSTYARAGEVVQAGQPLYRIANLDTLVLRAYVSESQLASFRIGQVVTVHVDQGKGKLMTLPGTVSWVSSTSEFTPTPVQTRDERADLVYAVKVLVQNRGGALKIGMPADLSLSAPRAAAASADSTRGS